MARSEKIKFLINRENFTQLIDKISDLTKISDIVKMKIDSENILVYSLVGETSILAFKNYLLKTSDYFTFSEDLEFTFDYVITGAKRFVKNLKFFNIEENIKGQFVYKDNPADDNGKIVRSLNLTDGKFKLNNIGGEIFKVRDITKEKLEMTLKTDNCNWQFSVSSSDFEDVRKLSSINADDNIITVSITDGDINFCEIGKWQLTVDKTESSHSDINFPKKYLSSVNNEEEIINFHIFDTFILFQERDKNLMVSFEQTFE